MTVTNTSPRADYVGNGSVSAYDFDFPVAATSEIAVYKTDLVGDVTELALTTGFTAVLNTDGSGTITLVAGNLTSGHLLSIVPDATLNQLTDFAARSIVSPANTQTAADRLNRQVQQVNAAATAAIRLSPAEDPADYTMTLPTVDLRANQTLLFDSDGNVIAGSVTTASATVFGQSLIDDATAAAARITLGGLVTSVDTVAAMTALTGNDRVGTVIVRGYYAKDDGGADVFFWDAASTATDDGVRCFESDAGGTGRFVRAVRSTLTLAQCGCRGDNTTDDITQFNAGIAYLFDLNGGTLLGTPGKTYKLSNGPLVKTGVRIDLQGCTVNLAFPNLSDYVGFDMRSHTALTNGTVNVVELGPPTSGDKSLHAAVVVGQSGGNYAGYTDVIIDSLVITTNRGGTLGGRGILVQTDSNNVKIFNIHFPSSAYLGSAVEIHVAANGVPNLTGHPHNIDVRNITLGTMTKSGTAFDIAAIDIVGCYNVTVDNVDCDAWAGDAVVQIRTGGYGSSLAGATVLPLFMKGITVSNVTCRSTTQSFVVINGEASIEAANPDYSIPCVVRNCKGTGIGASCTNFGIRAIKVYDCIFDNCEMQQFDRGCYIEEATRRITVRNSRFYKNNETGVLISHGTAPEDILIDACESYLNGQDGTNKAGFEVDTSTRVTFKDCTAGDYTSETTQYYGFLIQSASTLTHFRGINRVRNIKGGGSKYTFLSACYGDRQFCGGTNAVMNNAANAYAPICGVGASAAEVDSTVLSGSAKLLLTNLQVTLSAAPNGATKSFGIRPLVAGNSVALEVTMTDLVVSAADYDAAEVAAGSTLSIQSLPTNTPTASRGKWSIEVIGIE